MGAFDAIFDEPAGADPAAVALKHELSEMILWNELHAPRSLQRAIGPSELGDPCDRRVAYRIADCIPVNDFADPWPAIVGTAVHDWLEKAVNLYQAKMGDMGWLTELGVYPDPMVRGRSDVYNKRTKTVVDWKTGGPDMMKKVRKGNVPLGYITQVQIYGLGHVRSGRAVENVALCFLPRSGWLGDMYVWQEPYNEAVATAALKRMYDIAYRLIDLDIENNGHRFQMIEATPGDSCVFCPMFQRDMDPDVAASEHGCPGR